MSVYMLVFAGTTPFGSLLAGWLGRVGGTPFSMFICAALSALAVPFAYLYYRRNVRPRRSGKAPLSAEAASPSVEQ